MFRDLQKGYSVSILDKNGGGIRYYQGTVVSRSEPRFNDKVAFQPYLAEKVIDLTIEADGRTQTYVVPENGSIASAESFTIACDPSLVSNEVRSILKKSEDALASIGTHKANIDECNKILAQLDPALGESQQQAKRLDAIESKLDALIKKMSGKVS